MRSILSAIVILLLFLSAGVFFYQLWNFHSQQGVEPSPSPQVIASPSSSPSSPVTYKDLILLETPRSGADIVSPLRVSGLARGMWFFEASFPIQLVTEGGEVLAEGIAEAQADWMTEEFVPFEAILEFTSPASSQTGTLILQKANASGLPENDDQLVIPVRFR